MIITKTEITKHINSRSLAEEIVKIAVKIDSYTGSEDTGDLTLKLTDFKIENGSDVSLGTKNFTISKAVHEAGLSQLPAAPTFEQFLGLLYQLLLSDYNASPIYDKNKVLNNWEIRS